MNFDEIPEPYITIIRIILTGLTAGVAANLLQRIAKL